MFIQRDDDLFYEGFFGAFNACDREKSKRMAIELIDDLTNILTNYDTLKPKEFLRIIERIYYFSTDEDSSFLHEHNVYDNEFLAGVESCYEYYPIVNSEPITNHEMIKLYNMVGNTSYRILTSIKTVMFGRTLEGYYQGNLIVLTNDVLDRDKEYTREEIEAMIKNKIIFVIATDKTRLDVVGFVPKKCQRFKNYGVDKNTPEYEEAVLKLTKEAIPKERLFKDIRIVLKFLRKELNDYCWGDESTKEEFGSSDIDKFYQLKFRNKSRWEDSSEK